MSTNITRAASPRYVEVSYREPGKEHLQFRATIVEAQTPKEAARMALADTRLEHPQATEVEEFVQRKLTNDKARVIRSKFADGTWEGWPFASES